MAKARTFLVTGTLFIPNGESVGHAVDYIFARWHTAKIERIEREHGGKRLYFAIQTTQFNPNNATTIVVDTLRGLYIVRNHQVKEITE